MKTMETNRKFRNGGSMPSSSVKIAMLAVVLSLAELYVPGASGQNPHGTLITFDPPGSVDTRPFGINASGEIVGLYIDVNNVTHGFDRSPEGGFRTIDGPGAIRTNAVAINPSGQIVGRYDTPDGRMHGYLLNGIGGIFTTIDFPGSLNFTVVTDINPAGHMVGRYNDAAGRLHGFSLINGVFTTIDYPGAIAVQGIAINADGVIAGYYVDGNGRFHGFLLDRGVFTTFDPPGSVQTGGASGVLKINPSGVVAGNYGTSASIPSPCGCAGQHGFLYSSRSGDFTSFDFPGARFTAIWGVNPQGDVVGTYLDQTGRRHGFLAGRLAQGL